MQRSEKYIVWAYEYLHGSSKYSYTLKAEPIHYSQCVGSFDIKNMEILRIPSAYKTQIEYLSEKDASYVIKTLLSLSVWEDIIIEKSLRWWLVISIFREAINMENLSRARKWKEWLKIDIATLTGDTVVRQWERIKESKVKESNIKEKINKKEKNKEELERFIKHRNTVFDEKRKVTTDLEKAYEKIKQEYTFEEFKEWVSNYCKEKHSTEKQYLLTPLAFLTRKDKWFRASL